MLGRHGTFVSGSCPGDLHNGLAQISPAPGEAPARFACSAGKGFRLEMG